MMFRVGGEDLVERDCSNGNNGMNNSMSCVCQPFFPNVFQVSLYWRCFCISQEHWLRSIHSLWHRFSGVRIALYFWNYMKGDSKFPFVLLFKNLKCCFQCYRDCDCGVSETVFLETTCGMISACFFCIAPNCSLEMNVTRIGNKST